MKHAILLRERYHSYPDDILTLAFGVLVSRSTAIIAPP
jgi:hypothetical protein